MGRVIHFELNADDPERAAQFYQAAFGWQITKWGGPTDYWMVKTGDAGPGIDGGILKRPQPGATTVNTIGVDSIETAVGQITAAGGRLVVPKFGVPGVGWVAYCLDTEGNTFGIMQPDPAAH
ncbi:MAG TPA: VOC family protein [Thermoanaerobaculia bacterium]|nr:VOC family protein [Thermoanaerobaculia bacterium]